ncbi:hypothetical protein HMJ29_05010 [Hymenobacter taeanensis]|uniref:Uncharacterized protein n=1 Tax=Hymenobacter taeanensis TaxID=2735321 RepID=A0A6M6BEC3_9BACT|nr:MULTISPECIES: hypothetical protein [Hymenobacter]QJX46329.1 hypothetical protein HMJ29_05010 [Hymenobacter taeanensis]UOQ80188.1 hypothetical protein MUN83_15300 [Hymenobacter sp. 5414T-23]
MSEILLHSESYGEIALDPTIACLIVRWHGFANSRNYRFLLNKALELYQLHSPRFTHLGWLNDTRHFGAMLSVDQQWANTDWNPRAYAAGVRQMNFLSPTNVFGQIAVQQYTLNTAKRQEYRLEVREHQSLEEACHSLRTHL